jgi:transcriptional regulator with XRE-family HTH domain
MYESKLKKFRLEKGMTLENLADITKISIGYLCHLENGTRKNPSIETMNRISEALGKNIADIFFN